MCFKTKFLVILLSCVCTMWSCGEEESTAMEANMTPDTGWGSECQGDDDCEGATNLCVKNPMDPPETPGYCSIPCSSTSECEGSEMQWTCNVVGTCESPLATWCGPMSEIDDGMGVLVACE